MLRPVRFPWPLLVASCLMACSSDDDPGPTAALLDPPPEGRGVQFSMRASIAPGAEGEWCRFVVAPAEELWVTHDEVRFERGSHHFLLYETSYASIPTQRDDGVAVDTSGVFDCSEGATNGWSVTKLVGGSQNGMGDSMLRFPEGVAMPVRAGAVLLMNAHYVNASPEELTPEVRINLWTIPASSVTSEGDLLFMYNPLIRVGARSTSRARWRCPVRSDITLYNVQSHMHARGVGYSVGIQGESPFYQNDQWENVPVQVFPDGLPIRAGSVLDYWCDYDNPESRDVYQGARSTDEMCMLIGSYYPADSMTANCASSAGPFGGDWVGNGTESCAATLGCLQGAFTAENPLAGITDCMLDADPAVAVESSAVLRCVIDTAMAGGDPIGGCSTQIAACMAR